MRPFRECLYPRARTARAPTRTVRYVFEAVWHGRRCEVWWQEVLGGAYLWIQDPWKRRYRAGWLIPSDGRLVMPRSEVEETTVRFIKKALQGSEANKGPTRCEDDWLSKFAPAVAEFCTELKGPDGKDRVPSSLTVFYEDGQCKVCLGERNYDLSLWASGATLMEALIALEARLTAPSVEWRRRNGKNGHQGPAKKK